MATAGRSLRSMVENWLMTDPSVKVRVTEFGRMRVKRECYVRVETMRSAGPVALVFFRHKDGTWCIYPPNKDRPAMKYAI
jgi:hypothetical protein